MGTLDGFDDGGDGESPLMFENDHVLVTTATTMTISSSYVWRCCFARNVAIQDDGGRLPESCIV
jgi:hypothetical protein